jgi:hypothetical protein
MSSKSLKSEYAKWLWMLLVADLIAVLLFLVPGVPSGASLVELGNWRLLTTVVVPVVVLLLVNVLPHKAKCMLVYWKPYGWLPGCEVFSKYAPEDVRVDMEELGRHVGPLPALPEKQNARWYQLYKLIENEPEIAEAHKSFLMYRDMAVLSLPFIILAPVSLYFAGASAGAQWFGAVIFALQYLLTAVSARHNGIRFVTSVLAVHSARSLAGRATA